MGDSHIAGQRAHIARAEDVAHQAGAFVHVKRVALAGGNPRRILAAMLQHHQAIVKQLIDRCGRDNPEYPAHRVIPT